MPVFGRKVEVLERDRSVPFIGYCTQYPLNVNDFVPILTAFGSIVETIIEDEFVVHLQSLILQIGCSNDS